jgi:hypothetical protein
VEFISNYILEIDTLQTNFVENILLNRIKSDRLSATFRPLSP